MPVPNQTPITSHVGNGSTKTFAFNFRLTTQAALRVRVGGVLTSVGFTVSGIGGNTGSVTFTVAPGIGVSVVISRVIPLARTRDYQQNGDLLADTVDNDFDDIWMKLQELSLQIPTEANTLPPQAGNAGRYLYTDGNVASWQLGAGGGSGGGGGVEIVASEENFPGITSSDPDISTPALQAFLDACAGNLGVGENRLYYANDTLKWDPRFPLRLRGSGFSSDGESEPGSRIQWSGDVCTGIEMIYGYAQWAPGGGADAHRADDIENEIVPLGNSDNLVDIDGWAFYGQGADKLPGSQSIQLHAAGGETQATGWGLFAYWTNNLILRNCWFSGWPVGNVKFMWCFGSRIEGGYYVNSRSAGIVANNTNNLLVIDGAKVIGNGMVTGPFISFNILVGVEGVSPSSYPNLGVSIIGNTDVEGAGGNALPGYGFIYTDNALTRTLTNIVVSGGTATATCATTPLIAVGDFIGVYGGTTANGGLALNTVRPAVILTKVGNTLTWATGAPNGTYTTGMKIGPYVAGLGLKNCFAAQAKVYAEGTTGPAVYVYDDCRGVSIAESHINDAKIYIDGYYFSVQISPGGGRGTGYAVNDEFTLNGGVLAPGGSPTRLKVTAQTAGQVFGLAYVNQGQYLEPPLGTGLYNVIATTTQTGTGSGVVCISTWFPNSAEGVALERNQMYGSNGGITSVCHENVVLEGNQYLRSGPEQPKLDLGVFIRTLAPKLRETGSRISKGMMVGSGINQYIGPAVAADITNFAAGVGALQNLEGANDYTLPLAGKRNTGWGFRPGADLTTGANNIFGGTDPGKGITTGDGNLILDAAGSTCPSGLLNFTGLGFGSAAFAADNRVQLGSTNVSSARIQVSWTITSDSRAKTDIEPLDLGVNLVRLLEPKSYFRADANGDPVGNEEFGFTAQGALSALQSLGRGDHGMVDYDAANDLYGLRLADMIPVLVKAAQEIDARQDSLEARIAALEIL